MNKQLIYFLIIAVILFVVGFPLHSYFVSQSSLALRFSPFEVYSYNFVASILIYITVQRFARIGYLYLVLSMVKMLILILIYGKEIFGDIGLNSLEKTVLLIPFLMFLLLETLGVVKLLNATDFSKKTR